MANDKKTDWSGTEAIIKGDQSSERQRVFPEKRSMELHQKAQQTLESPEGIIAKYKAKQIERKAVVSYLQSWYDTQLDVGRKRLEETGKIKNAEMKVEAQRFYAELQSKLDHILDELDMKNVQRRQKMMVNLASNTSEILAVAQKKDMPDSLKEQAIKGIKELSDRIFIKLLTDVDEE